MSARLTKVDFEAGDDFELYPTYERTELEARFAALKQGLVATLVEEATPLALQPRLERAANEAAAVAWTTEFPLLVFPALFDEFARRERARENRQQQIRVKSERLMECAV